MTAPVYTAACRYIDDYEAADPARRRRMSHAQYEACLVVRRAWDDADRRCPRPADSMTPEYRADVVAKVSDMERRAK